MSGNGLRLAVALYSYMQEYRSERFDLDALIGKASELGCEGIEIVNSSHLPDWPHTSGEQLKGIRRTVAAHGLELSCCGAYTDTAIKPGAMLSFEEMVEMMKRELRFTHELECSVMRAGPITPLEVEEECLPYAQELGVKIGVEIHAPWKLEFMGEGGLDLDKLKEIDSQYFGIIPDMGAFVDRMPERFINKAEEMGASRYLVEQVSDMMIAGATLDWILNLAAELGVPEEFDDPITLFYHLCCYQDPSDLGPYVPYIVNIHGKFYDIDESGEEPSINYRGLVHMLRDSGYEGFMCSEYEGWALDKEPRGFDMVKKHQELIRKYLEE